MMPVVSLHLGLLSGNFRDTCIVCAVQLLQLRLQIVSFNDQFFIDARDIFNLRAIVHACAIQVGDLVLEFGGLLVGTVEFLL